MRLLITVCVSVLTFALASTAGAQNEWMKVPNNPRTVPLWPEGVPGAVGQEDADKPAITIYLPAPAQATGTAIVICPGGGYSGLAIDHEGHQVARLLTSRGIAGFVLKYRLGPRYHHPAMLQDVLQAIRYVRGNAAELEIKPDRIGVMGFSAGGHLASTAATLFDDPDGTPAGTQPAVSARPDFAVLAYPVIVMGDAPAHTGSQRNLLGENAPAALVAKLSTDRQVTAKTPPTFLFHTTEDAGVPVENSVRFYLALRKAGVPAELHAYEKGVHGVGLAPNDPVLRTWTDRLFDWLEVRGFGK